MVERSAPVRVRMPTSAARRRRRPARACGARRRAVSKACCGDAVSVRVSTGAASSPGAAGRSDRPPAQSASVTTPDRPLVVDDDDRAVCALGQQRQRLADRAVRREGQRRVDDEVAGLTQATTSRTTSTGMSCGSTARPPRRATVSAIRRPATAVMFATTSGIVAPLPSTVARSTSKRDADVGACRDHEHVVVGQLERRDGADEAHESVSLSRRGTAASVRDE